MPNYNRMAQQGGAAAAQANGLDAAQSRQLESGAGQDYNFYTYPMQMEQQLRNSAQFGQGLAGLAAILGYAKQGGRGRPSANGLPSPGQMHGGPAAFGSMMQQASSHGALPSGSSITPEHLGWLHAILKTIGGLGGQPQPDQGGGGGYDPRMHGGFTPAVNGSNGYGEASPDDYSQYAALSQLWGGQ